MTHPRSIEMNLLAIAIVTLWSAPGLPQTPSLDPSLGRALDAWVASWNSYDLDQVDALFVVGPDTTYFSSEKPGLIRGIDAVREHHRGFGFVPGGKASDAKLWIDDVHATLRDGTALVAATWYFRRGADESGEPQKGPMTIVYVREAGAWRILHMHFANW
jgi:hypothetical protein